MKGMVQMGQFDDYRLVDPPKLNSIFDNISVPEIKKIDLMGETNAQLQKINETNTAIKERLESAENEIATLKGQLKQMEDAHKYDLIKEFAVGFICALLGALAGVLFAKML